jgi:hypothetical protein
MRYFILIILDFDSVQENFGEPVAEKDENKSDDEVDEDTKVDDQNDSTSDDEHNIQTTTKNEKTKKTNAYWLHY